MNDPLIFVRRFRETHIDLKNEAGIDIGIGVSGKYLVEVCRDGKVIRQPFGPKMRPNLITNGLFDFCMTSAFNAQFRQAIVYAVVGTGTTAPANTDIKLTTYSQQTASLFTGGGSTFSNDTVNGAWTGTFVYEFPAVGAGITYNEAGLNQTSSTTTGLSSHILFPSGVVLNTGDNLRLTYSFTWSIPCLVTPITVSLAAVNGFNVSGSMKLCGAYSNIFGTVLGSQSSVTTNGVLSVFNAGLMLGTSASGVQAVTLNSAPTTFPAVNANITPTIITGASGTSALATYTNGTFTRNQTWTWTPSQPSTTASNVNCIGLIWDGTNSGLFLILTSAQTKANTNTLAITASCTMARA